MLDLVVAGAGPAGLELAFRCQNKMNVAVVEEHKRIGEPNHCSGLVSRNIDGIAKPPRDCVEHRVRGALLHSPGGHTIELKKRGFAAYVIDRQSFDNSLAERLNCRLLMGSKLERVAFGGGSVSLTAGRKNIECCVIAGADGANSFVAKSLGVGPKEKIPGIIAIAREPNASEFVELFFDKRLTDCFLWKIPRGEATEYGMWGSGSRFDVLEKFFKIKNKKYARRSGVIPLGPPKTYFNRAILVGDAAGQCKPWTGGGVVYGMTCARIAADVLTKADGFSEQSLRGYEVRWKRAIGKQIGAGMLGRRLLARLSNRQLDAFMATARWLRLLNRLDMDFLVKK